MKSINVTVDYSPLLQIMKEKNISGYYLAKEWGIPHKTIYNIRHGKVTNLDTIIKLSLILEVQVQDMFHFKYEIIEHDGNY